MRAKGTQLMSISMRSALVFFIVCGSLMVEYSLLSADEMGVEFEEPIQELFLGETVFPQERFELQISTGTMWTKTDTEDLIDFPLQVEFGLSDRFQIEVEISHRIQTRKDRSTSGIAHIELGAMYNFYRSPTFDTAFSGGIELSFPNQTSNLSEEVYGFEPFIIVYKALGALHTNLHLVLEIEVPTDSNPKQEIEVGVETALGVFMPLGTLFPPWNRQLRWRMNGCFDLLPVWSGTPAMILSWVWRQ